MNKVFSFALINHNLSTKCISEFGQVRIPTLYYKFELQSGEVKTIKSRSHRILWFELYIIASFITWQIVEPYNANEICFNYMLDVVLEHGKYSLIGSVHSLVKLL